MFVQWGGLEGNAIPEAREMKRHCSLRVGALFTFCFLISRRNKYPPGRQTLQE